MKLSDAQDLTKEVDRKILELIDYKTDEDMKQVISEIRLMESKITTLYWVIGIAFAVMAVFMGIIALK